MFIGLKNPKKKKAESTRKTKLERYGDENYNNSSQNKVTCEIKYGNPNYNNSEQRKLTNQEKYNCDNVAKNPEIAQKISDALQGHVATDVTRERISNSRTGSHLSDEKLAQKIYNTNKTYHEKDLYKRHKTKPELFVEKILIDTFGEDDVKYSYVDVERYPFKCDFYVESADLFIEVHAGWRHNNRPFDDSDDTCLLELEEMLKKSETKQGYKNAIYQWTDLDVRKLNCAIQNNLNFVRLYDQDIYFINEKPRELLETLLDLYHPKDNQQPRLPIWK